MKSDVRLRPVFNKRFGRWSICHNQWCEKGETSIVAQIMTSSDSDSDKEWAEKICEAFNMVQEAVS
jgi:hypothetical protein